MIDNRSVGCNWSSIMKLQPIPNPNIYINSICTNPIQYAIYRTLTGQTTGMWCHLYRRFKIIHLVYYYKWKNSKHKPEYVPSIRLVAWCHDSLENTVLSTKTVLCGNLDLSRFKTLRIKLDLWERKRLSLTGNQSKFVIHSTPHNAHWLILHTPKCYRNRIEIFSLNMITKSYFLPFISSFHETYSRFASFEFLFTIERDTLVCFQNLISLFLEFLQ